MYSIYNRMRGWIHYVLQVFEGLWSLEAISVKMKIYEFLSGIELKVWVGKGGKVYIVLMIDILM